MLGDEAQRLYREHLADEAPAVGAPRLACGVARALDLVNVEIMRCNRERRDA
jgi:hypothetical protein